MMAASVQRRGTSCTSSAKNSLPQGFTKAAQKNSLPQRFTKTARKKNSLPLSGVEIG
jgi:hypothetical protein